MRGKAIPVRSGVYLLEGDEGLYIGQTRNLYQRYGAHVSAGKIHNIEFIFYEFIEDEWQRKQYESLLIREFLACGIVLLNKVIR